jgi:hypothetical protein
VLVSYVKFSFPYQILPGLTVHDLRDTDNLARYLNMGKDVKPAPEMTMVAVMGVPHIKVGKRLFPLASIDHYELKD